MNGSGNGRADSAPGDHDETNPQPGYTEQDGAVVLESGISAVRFDPAHGGRLARWQWRAVAPPDRLNPATRNDPPRPYDLVDPSGGALVDHFIPLGSKPDEFAVGTHQEYGDFFDTPYDPQVIDLGGEIRLGLSRDGEIRAGKRSAGVRVIKSVAVRPGAGDIVGHYRLISESSRPLQILFAIEYNLYPPGAAEHPDTARDAFYLVDGERPTGSSVGSSGVSPGATSLALGNPSREMALQLGWDRECDLWRLPSQSSNTARLLAVWRLQLPPGDNWAMGLWLAPS
jgi:hypothetical protein